MRKTALLLVALTLTPFLPAPAQEQPCNDPLAIISNRPRPNVLILVDTSGSMLWDSLKVSGNDITVRKENQNGTVNVLRYVYGSPSLYSMNTDEMKCFLVDSDSPRSRIGQAKAALREIVSEITDINIGIGRFKKTLVLNRFRATLPSDLNQAAAQDPNYNYQYWDNQAPSAGQINIPYLRIPVGGGSYQYPFCNTVRNPGTPHRTWDPLDTVWLTTTSNYSYIGADFYSRMNWSYSYIENARYENFRSLTADGDFIYRDTYAGPDATHRNKLNQVDNVDIFLSDEEFLAVKANTALGQTLTVDRYVDSVYDVPVQRTLTFSYYPTTADWDYNTSCSTGEILVDVQNRFLDDFDTPEDESDNKDRIIAAAGSVTTNALIYDFEAEGSPLTTLGPFFGSGGTPLGETLNTAKSYFQNTIVPRDQGYNVAHCRENFVILLTDGYETCGGSPESVALDLYENLGIKVYVIAFVSTTAQADAIAAAGGTDQSFTAQNKEELLDALKQIFSEIKTSVQLAAPVAGSTTRRSESIVEGNVALLPFFDFPGFHGRLQARKLFKNCVVSIDTKTGAIVTNADGDPVILQDDLTDEQVADLTPDIAQDPAREIVGLQLDPPEFMWDSGELLSLRYFQEGDSSLDYDYCLADTGDLDSDGNTSELIVNPAYKTADQRLVLTTLSYGTGRQVIDFSEADLLDADGDTRDLAVDLLDVQGWSDSETRFLINYVRGKQVRRFTEETDLYGHTFQPGDPMPDPASPDADLDGIPDGYLYQERSWKLGDIISSTTAVVTPPLGKFPITINDDDDTLDDYTEFVEANEDIPSLVLVGSNDGMLHAFAVTGIDGNGDGDFADSGDYYPGAEVWAFVLPDAFSKFKSLYYDSPNDDDFAPDGQRLNPHQYFIDGTLTLAIVRARFHTGDTDGDGKSDDPEFRMMLTFGLGRGGDRYWAFDLTDPMNPVPVWSFTHSSMGMALSRPAVGPVAVTPTSELDQDFFKYYIFMGSGYDYSQTDGSADAGNVLYQLDVNDGSLVSSFDAGDESGGAGIPNAIVGRAITVDDDDDFFVERVYFGDLDGNLWRWSLVTGSIVNLLDVGGAPITTLSERLERPIVDSYTYANIFGYHVVTAATGGDTRRYIDDDGYRLTYPDQRIYMIVDTDRDGQVRSLLNGAVNEDGEFVADEDETGIQLPDYRVAENIPVVTAFTEYDDAGKIYRGFQTFYPLYIPDPAGLRTIRCTFGSSELVILDSIFSEAAIVESTSGVLVSMGEGKATGISYVGGNIIFSIGDKFNVLGQGIYRFEASQRVKAKLKVLSWREVF